MKSANFYQNVPKFIKNINKLFSTCLRESEDDFYVEIFYSNDDKIMFFVRHIVADKKKTADIVAVKLDENAEITKDGTTIFLNGKTELEGLEDKKFFLIGESSAQTLQ
jgi:hypothetical protein